MPADEQTDLNTNGISIANMSTEDMDAFLSQISAEQSSRKADSQSETTESTATDDALQIDDIDRALDQIDRQLADLEGAYGTTNDDDEVDTCEAEPSDAEVVEVENRDEGAAQEDDSEDEDVHDRPWGEADAILEEIAEKQTEPQIDENEDEINALADNEEDDEEDAPSAPCEEAQEAVAARSAGWRRYLNPLYLLKRAVYGLLWLPIQLLIVLDKPFANMSVTKKTLLGCVSIATCLVAAATWLFGTLSTPTG